MTRHQPYACNSKYFPEVPKSFVIRCIKSDESAIALPLVRIFIDEVEDYPEVNVVFGIHVGAGLGVLVVHHTVVTELPVAVGGREADSGKSVP